MKKISIVACFMLAFVMVFSSVAYATEYIVDDTSQQYITVEESENLDTVAKTYRDNYGFGIYYYYDNTVDGNLVDFSKTYYKEHCNNDTNGVLLSLTDDKYYVYKQGDAEKFLDTDMVWEAFAPYDTYYEGVANYINYVGEEIVKYYGNADDQNTSGQVGTTSLPNSTLKSDGSLVYDNIDILDDSEEAELEEKLNELSEKHKMDIAVVVVDGLDGKTPTAFADDYYDYNEYGQGSEKDGVVLMLSMAERDWHFTTTGKAISVFSDDAQSYIFSSDNVLGYFKNDDWISGFECYADQCDACITAYEDGKTYPENTLTDYLIAFGICLGIGLLCAVIFMAVIKGQHKSVRKKAEANDYYVNGSLRLTGSSDTFIYSNVSKTPRSNSSSSSGSSTHTSSSGTSHGGSGGKF